MYDNLEFIIINKMSTSLGSKSKEKSLIKINANLPPSVIKKIEKEIDVYNDIQKVIQSMDRYTDTLIRENKHSYCYKEFR